MRLSRMKVCEAIASATIEIGKEDEQTNLVDSTLKIILNFGYEALNAFEKGRNPLVMSKICVAKMSMCHRVLNP